MKRAFISILLFVLLVGCTSAISPTITEGVNSGVPNTSFSGVKPDATPVKEKECVADCELLEILSKDFVLDPDGDVQASLKDFSRDRSLGDIYHDPNGALKVDTDLQVDYPVDGHIETKNITVTNPASIAGYYQAPNGKWYAIGRIEE